MGTTYAYCWASGTIWFGEDVPCGALPIVEGEKDAVYRLMETAARYACDGKTLLVPGIPEAEDLQAKADAFALWVERLEKCAPEGLSVTLAGHQLTHSAPGRITADSGEDE